MKVHHPLTVGSHGAPVRRLEERLKLRGLLEGPVNDVFDAKTQAAVKKLEHRHHWHVDGIVGNRIWKRLHLSGAAHEGSVGHVNTGGGTPSSGGGTSGSTNFSTVNINVKSNPLMPQSAVVHDVREAAKQGSVIGWNEISPGRYFDAIKGLGPGWGHYMPHDGGLRIPNPISWKKSEWSLVSDGFKKTHNGKAKVSPNRYITWVKLKNKETGKTIVRMNTHLVSGTFSGKGDHAWRLSNWHKHMKILDQMVKHFEGQGYPVIIGGDFNRDSNKVLGNQVQYDNNIHVGTHGRSTYDYVMHTPNAALKKLGAKIDHNFKSDHDAVVIKYHIKG